MKRLAPIIVAPIILAIFLASPAAADPTVNLKSAIDAARGESGCPPLKIDPLLTGVAQSINRQVDQYVRHAPTARTLPVTGDVDLVPTGRGGLEQALIEAGYYTANAKLLSGYGDYRTGGTGDNESKAIRATVLEGLGAEALSDCGYTKYGVSAINNDSTGEGWPSTPPRTYSVTTVVLAGNA
jgi:hypothetical protein